MSPDDHYADLKRVIAAAGGKARRINVIMPFLYESRQHKRTGRESLDCALMLQELTDMGVENIITFDAHDPRVHNAIPLKGFAICIMHISVYQVALLNVDDLHIDSDHMMAISPDEGAMGRAVYFANVLGLIWVCSIREEIILLLLTDGIRLLHMNFWVQTSKAKMLSSLTI